MISKPASEYTLSAWVKLFQQHAPATTDAENTINYNSADFSVYLFANDQKTTISTSVAFW